MSFWKSKHRVLIPVLAAVLIVVLLFGACAIYVSDYYRADATAIAAFLPEVPIAEQELDGGIAYGSPQSDVGFIFYPGGKVEHTAYVPLMRALAARGIFCVLLEMPLRLAVLDVNAADGVREQFPDVTRWYLGGHSLGGSMAASYLSKHTEEYSGLVLLGSYSTADLSQSDLSVLSVYGSEDLVMDREKYAENKANLPSARLTETVLEGGCHAYFGMYGAQEGDGVPTLSNGVQIQATADAVLAMMIRDAVAVA